MSEDKIFSQWAEASCFQTLDQLMEGVIYCSVSSSSGLGLTSQQPLFLYLVIQSSAYLPGMSNYCLVLSCARKDLSISPESSAPGSGLKYVNGCPFILIGLLCLSKKLDINLKAVRQTSHF